MKTQQLFDILEDSELIRLADEHPEALIDICTMMSLEAQQAKELKQDRGLKQSTVA